jgi:DNA replication protein DnaC
MERINQTINKLKQQPSHQEILKISSDPTRFELAKKMFWAMAQRVAKKELKPAFVMDHENQDAVKQFVAWFTGDEATMAYYNMHPLKGIYIMGNPGSGKSMLFRIVKACLFDDEYRGFFRPFRMYTSEHVAKLFMKDGDDGIEVFTRKAVKKEYGRYTLTHACFDDLGSEEIKNNYGNKKEVMVDVILQRYDLMLEHGLITHFTGNLTMEEIATRYSDRVSSRITHMCNVIKLGGSTNYTDRRKL